jgi:hypothetical protein
MKWSHRWLFLVAALLLPLAAAPASAQYMYLDANANGIHDAGDVLNANGAPTTVDVWLITNQNRDGSEAVCNTGDGILQINSYAVNLLAQGGTVTYGGFVNQQTAWTVAFGELNTGDGGYKNGFGGPVANALPPGGPYRLMTVTITGVSGAPSIIINDINTGSADFTSFGTACSGNDFDNTYKLSGPGGGSDWTDVDGLGAAVGGNNAPVLAAIGDKTVTEGVQLSFTATATDADSDPLTFSLGAGAPAGAVITSGGAFTWTPTEAQGPGIYQVTVNVTDGTDTDSETINIQVSEANQAPVLAAMAAKRSTRGRPSASLRPRRTRTFRPIRSPSAWARVPRREPRSAAAAASAGPPPRNRVPASIRSRSTCRTGRPRIPRPSTSRSTR